MNTKLIKSLIALGTAIATGLGALFGRMDGGGGPKVPEIVERLLIMSFFVIACIPFAEWWSLLALVGALGVITGLGQYFLEVAVKAIEPEKIDVVVKLLFGKDPRTEERFAIARGVAPPDLLRLYPNVYRNLIESMGRYGFKKLYWRCVFGLGLRGQIVGLPAMILALVYGAWLSAFFFSLVGIFTSFAYMIAWKVFKSTEHAEWFNGGFRTLLAMSAFVAALFEFTGVFNG